MDLFTELAGLLAGMPAVLKIVGIAVIIAGASLPLLKGSHPAYLLIAFLAVLAFFLVLISWLTKDNNTTWLHENSLRCVIVTNLNPNGAHNLAIRTGPSTEETEIAQRYTGQKLWVHGETNGWVKVRFIDQETKVEGWAARNYTSYAAC